MASFSGETPWTAAALLPLFLGQPAGLLWLTLDILLLAGKSQDFRIIASDQDGVLKVC